MQTNDTENSTSNQQQYQQSSCTHWHNKLNLNELKDRFHSIEFQNHLRDTHTSPCVDCRKQYDRTSCWICLHCNQLNSIRCGRYDKQHALLHANNNNHPLAINIAHRGIFCYTCDDDLKQDDINASGLQVIVDSIIPNNNNINNDQNNDEMQTDDTNNNTSPHNQHQSQQYNNGNNPQQQSTDDSVLQQSWLDYYNNHDGGKTGLVNLGNTCFMNSGLQSLLHCPPLIAFFTRYDDLPQLDYIIETNQYHNNSNEYRLRLLNDFSLLLRKVWSGVYTVCGPNQLYRDIVQLNPFFQGYQQHDTHEFIRCLLDNLHESIKVVYEYDYLSPQYNGNITSSKLVPPTPPSNMSPRSRALSGYRGAKPIEQQSLDNNSHTTNDNNNSNNTDNNNKPPPVKKYDHSIISDIFEGLVRSQVKCSNCGHVSEVCDPFYDLSLEIPKENQLKKVAQERGQHILNTHNVNNNNNNKLSTWWNSFTSYVGLSDTPTTLNQCLHSFSTSDDLTHSDQYNCDKCKTKVDAIKTLSIAKLPEILCIHIKRFSHNSYFSSKIGKHISFPVNNLDMASFCTKSVNDTNNNSNKDTLSTSSHSSNHNNKTNGKSSKKNKDSKDNNNHHDSNNNSSNGSSDDSMNSSNNNETSTMYDLFGLVRHIGSTGGGHYIGYGKSHLDNIWYEFDDRTVKPITEDKLVKLEAYILFYRRHSNKQQLLNIDKQIQSITVINISDVNINNEINNTISKPIQYNDTNQSTVYLSRFWLKKIQVLGRVEPIDNRDLRCKHGYNISLPIDGGDKSMPITLSGWHRLITQYGGGPLATGKYEQCIQCELPRIRQQERDRIGAIDREASRLASPNDPFYIVHTQWLNQWRSFVQDNGPRPGHISNTILLQDDGLTPLPNLQKSIDYRGLHGSVFKELLKIYGGGPVLIRSKLNIYDNECNQDLIQKMQQKQQLIDHSNNDTTSDTDINNIQHTSKLQLQTHTQQTQSQSQSQSNTTFIHHNHIQQQYSTSPSQITFHQDNNNNISNHNNNIDTEM